MNSTTKPTLGILLNLGDCFKQYQKSGRDIHWRNNYLIHYPKIFRKPLVFSYAKEKNPYPNLISLFQNPTHLPRFIYTFLLPLIYFKKIKSCQVLRIKQMPGVWPAIITKLFFKTPIVSTYGYDYFHFAKKEGIRFSLPFIKLTEIIGLHFSNKVIVTNQQMLAKVSQIIPKAKIVLLPNGVNASKFKPSSKLNSTNQPIKILTISRLVHQKNLFNLIKAVSNLTQSVELTIVGRGPLEKKLKDLAFKLKVNLKHQLSLPHDQLPQLYQSADIFILPSHHEGSPKVLLEAMACGLPCVVADKPYSRFIIKNNQNGLLVNNSSKGLAQGLNSLINQPQLTTRLGKNARQAILQSFNNQEIIKKEIKLLLSVVNEK
jgi:glycosyltransferase involved in cell wall biosynthesis